GGLFKMCTKAAKISCRGAVWKNNRNRYSNAAKNKKLATAASLTTLPADVKKRFDYNRFGASVGGPIRKDKFFIYGAYEFQNEGLGVQGATVITPTAAGMSQLLALNPDSAVVAVLDQFSLSPRSYGKGPCLTRATHPLKPFSCANRQA